MIILKALEGNKKLRGHNLTNVNELPLTLNAKTCHIMLLSNAVFFHSSVALLQTAVGSESSSPISSAKKFMFSRLTVGCWLDYGKTTVWLPTELGGRNSQEAGILDKSLSWALVGVHALLSRSAVIKKGMFWTLLTFMWCFYALRLTLWLK